MPEQAQSLSVLEAFKTSLFAALVAFGLCIPIIALRTEQDINNVLVLQPRWGLVLQITGVVFIGRFLYTLGLPAMSPLRPASTALPRHGNALGVAGLVLLLMFPALMLVAVGPSGAIKWVDNFGVQILIYVMLGWGLNIVVGLAGLLDLGYVA